jgi:hypothetical protein
VGTLACCARADSAVVLGNALYLRKSVFASPESAENRNTSAEQLNARL